MQACACGLATAVYFGIVIYSSQRDGMKGIDPYYFFASTVTTVGFGDLHPQSREARMLAIRKYKNRSGSHRETILLSSIFFI